MSPIALVVGVLAAGGVYLILQRGIVRMTLGFILLGHAANVILLASGGLERRGVPIVGASDIPGDPLPQAFVLTAIVIGFGLTAFLLALAFRAGDLFGGDDTEPGGDADPGVDADGTEVEEPVGSAAGTEEAR